MNADHQTSFTVEAKGTPPTKGLWDCPVDMEVVYQFKNPDWTLVWGQPGNKVGKTEFGNVFWGDRTGASLVLEWEGGYRPAEPEAVNFKLPPGGVRGLADRRIRRLQHEPQGRLVQGHPRTALRPAVDIEIAHRTATLCNLGNLSYILGRKLVWDGVKQQVVGDDAANRLLGPPQRHPYRL